MAFNNTQDFFDRVADIDLAIKYQIVFLLHDVDKAEINGELDKMYLLLNILYKRLYPLIKKDKEKFERISQIISDLDVLHDRNHDMGYKLDDWPKVKTLLGELQIILNVLCVDNKFWYKKQRDEWDIYKDVQVVKEQDEGPESNP